MDLEPGISKKSEADRVLGKPIREIVKGERYDYDPKEADTRRLSIKFNKGTQIIEGIDIYPQGSITKAKYQKWLGLKTPQMTWKNQNGNLIEYYMDEGIALLYSGPQDSYPVECFSHFNVWLLEEKKTSEVAVLPPKERAAVKSPTELIIGKWRWFNGLIVEITSGEIVAKDNRGNMVNSGSWRVLDATKRKFEVKWRGGDWVDTLTLSPDNNSLEGTNQRNERVSANRITK